MASVSAKLVFHLATAAAAVYLINLHSRTHGVTQRLVGQDFLRAFFPADYAKYNGDDTDNPQPRYFLFTQDELRASITSMLNGYWNASTALLVPTLTYADTAAGDADAAGLQPPTAYWTHYAVHEDLLLNASHWPSVETVTDTIPLPDPAHTFPLSGPVPWPTFLSTTASLSYDLRLRLTDPMPDTAGDRMRGCSDWSAVFTYSFAGRGNYEVTWAYRQVAKCDSAPHAGVWTLLALSMLAALGHVGAVAVGTAREGNRFLEALRLQAEDPVPGVSLSLRDCLALIKGMDVAAGVGSTLIAGHTMALLANSLDMGSGISGEGLGIAGALLLVSLLKWVSFSPRFYSTVLTLHAALPKIALFLVGALPIFVAFAVFALAVFGRHAVRYGTGVMSFMTLFAFINGDALTEIYEHTQGPAPPASAYWAKAHRGEAPDWWWSPAVTRGNWSYGLSFYTVVGDLHLVLITFAFMYVVLNIMVGIIEEAFFATRDAATGKQLLQEVEGEERRVRAAVAVLVDR